MSGTRRPAVAIVGAGVVGTACASAVARRGFPVFLLEKHGHFGMETSSRNSEVIHSSIYYPPESLKARLCSQGRDMLYELCQTHGIPHNQCGKLIVATDEREAARLPSLHQRALRNGAPGVRVIDGDEMRELEPGVEGVAALLCPASGVIDSHELMEYFLGSAMEYDTEVVYNCELQSVSRRATSYELHTNQGLLTADVVVNSAGLSCADVAAMIGIDAPSAGYLLRPRKGVFFQVTRDVQRYPRMLVYPVPPAPGDTEGNNLGAHTIPNVHGGMRLGPLDVGAPGLQEGIIPATTAERYAFPEGVAQDMVDSLRRFLPFVEQQHLVPDTCGLHPTVEVAGGGATDFIIRTEEERGHPHWLNLISIDSPGLTSSPAIGEMVADMVDDMKSV